MYMFQFQFESKKFWIDAVAPCECHPDKKLKGRMLNNSRKNPNVIPRVKFIQERPHILLYTKKSLKKTRNYCLTTEHIKIHILHNTPG